MSTAGLSRARLARKAASVSVMEMPDGTVVPFVGALPAWPENSTTVPLFSPLETRIV
jgi:hypothetical protein